MNPDPSMNPDPLIRKMTSLEVEELVSWAAREGWNPGLHDAELFWATDADAFLAAELDGVLIGGGAITSYQGDFGFMGLFILRPEFRNRGLGDRLWQSRRDRLIARLKPGATIGMDGVFNMQPYYAKGGFAFSHRDLRFRAEIPARPPHPPAGVEEIVPLAEIPFEQVLVYDRTCFPASRQTFLSRWITQPTGLALGCRRAGQFCGFGVVRRCGLGCKIGPLFADDGQAALTLYAHLAEFAAGGPLFLDIPENNAAALDLARRLQMEQVFGCARMYLGAAPELAHHHIFGVTTFELG